jgi:hypothetical protein
MKQDLFQIPTLGVPRWVVGKEAKHKDANKNCNNDVNNNFERDHFNSSKGIKC